MTAERARKKRKQTLFSLLSCPLSTQCEEQHNYEKTLMYLNQSEDTTTLRVIEGTLQYKTFKGITCCLGHSLKKGNKVAASAWKSSCTLVGVSKNYCLYRPLAHGQRDRLWGTDQK